MSNLSPERMQESVEIENRDTDESFVATNESEVPPSQNEGVFVAEVSSATTAPVGSVSQSEVMRLRAELVEALGESDRIYESEFAHEAREFIASVDYDTLRGIFVEMRLRSGVRGESGFCGPERVQIDELLGGGQHGMKDGIKIGPRFLSRKEGSDFSRAEFRNLMLSILMHEETHASAANFESGDDDSTATKAWKVARSFVRRSEPEEISGYQRKAYTKGSLRKSFLDFNEGVTDKIAEEVYREYVGRTGDRALVEDDEHKAEYHVEAYLGSRAMVTAFVENLAASVGVPSDVAWDAVKQGYIAGIDLRDTELSRTFDGLYSEGFTERFAKYGAGEEGDMHDEFIAKSEALELSEEAKGRVRSAFAAYQAQIEEQKKKREEWRRAQLN